MAPAVSAPSKICARCGRSFSWRKRWRTSWESVRYCSDACRSPRFDRLVERAEAAVLALLARRDPAHSICPSEAARQLDPEGWRGLMSAVHAAARRLALAGAIEITQRGRVLDPDELVGAVRLRRKQR